LGALCLHRAVFLRLSYVIPGASGALAYSASLEINFKWVVNSCFACVEGGDTFEPLSSDLPVVGSNVALLVESSPSPEGLLDAVDFECVRFLAIKLAKELRMQHITH
jgi:hypothetical protein